MKVSIGCQTITYGDPQHDRFEAIFQELERAGYTGVEIGYRRLRNLPAERVTSLLRSRGLELIAGHVGGNLEDPDQAGRERSMLAEVLDYLNAANTPRLMYSGLHFESESQFERDLAMIFRAAEQCRARGVRLLYHNHDWEFADDWRVYSRLVEAAPDSLGFCVDVGWVEKAGMDSIEVLTRVADRLEAVHFKDFATIGNREMDTVVLGTGVIDLAKVASWLKRRSAPVWAIAEQDVASGTADETVRRNGAFLTNLFR